MAGVKEFGSLAALAAEFSIKAATLGASLAVGLEKAAARIEKTARSEMGEYQPAVGPFVAWAPLAPATLKAKEAGGYKTPNPGVETGQMLASFQHEVDQGRLEAIAGATDEKMVWFEFGTAKQPPRPVWGPAGLRNGEAVAQLVGMAAVAGLFGDVANLRTADDMAELTGPGYRFTT